MKRFATVLLLTAALCVKTSNGARGPSYNRCKETTVPVPCPPDALPGGSCTIERWGWNGISGTDDGWRNADCKNLRLNETLRGAASNSQNLVDVKLGVYQYRSNNRNYPIPNISFSKINCTYVMARLSVENTDYVSCINFTFSSSDHKMMETGTFLYDCYWFKSQYHFSNNPMIIEYQAGNGGNVEYKKYSFKLPPNGTADREETQFHDFKLLVYREEEFDAACSTFHWSPPPEKFNVSKYRVTLLGEAGSEEESENLSDTKKRYCSLPEIGSKYRVSVKPFGCSEKGCDWGPASISESFFTKASRIYMFILLVGLVLIFIILIFLCCWYYIKLSARQRKTKFQDCILVYEPSCKNHIIVLEKLVEFLESLHMKVAFAERDIQNQDSTLWYSRNLKKAKLVLIVSNPVSKNTLDVVTASTYYPVYIKGCVKTLLKDIIGDSEKKFIRILLPYCTQKDFYEFTTTKKCYHLLREPYRFLHEVMGPYFWLPPFLSRILFAPYLLQAEWRDLVKATNFNLSEETAPLKVEVGNDDSFIPSSPPSDEKGPADVDYRVTKLLVHKRQDSSGSESVSQEIDAQSQKSDDVAFDVLVDDL